MKTKEYTLLIDLDGTVYDKHNGMWEEMSTRIAEFMRAAVGIAEEDVVPTREKYYRQYGSSLRGLQIHHQVDTEEYLAYVHGMDLSKYLAPDPDLRYHLNSIPYKKWIFTNSDRNHTQRVLEAIGIEDLFEGIMDVWTMHHIPKPESWTYRNARAMVGNPDPKTTIFVDDTIKNLVAPNKMGWQTVWIDDSPSNPQVSYTIPKLHYLPNVIEQIEAQAQLNRVSHRRVQPANLSLAMDFSG
jgi:putative hydrolase of the HAD superfamily